ncbi:hypothetical protein NCC78_11870 [Micromonospora phytophila]|uniref:hypothetical protein n=1 Tax=Micromonospora phytophila TaxID=709888 RepID=UPI00202FF4BF|nr:hypothetical protein [Micromonospora phytophila]MCM0675380.1 hypothetical protein [Micromonospora phytophila]
MDQDLADRLPRTAAPLLGTGLVILPLVVLGVAGLLTAAQVRGRRPATPGRPATAAGPD